MGTTRKHTRYALTDEFMRALKATGQPQEYADTDLRGFTVRVTPAGRITYSYRWRRANGRPARITVGCYNEGLKPKDARAKARRESALLDHKGDTLLTTIERRQRIEQVQSLAGVPTLAAFLVDHYGPYLELYSKQGNKDGARIIQSFPELLHVKLNEIEPGYFSMWRTRQAKTGLKPATINRKMTALKGAFSHAVKIRLITASPAAGDEDLHEFDPKKMRALTFAEEPALRAALDARETAMRAERERLNRDRRRRRIPGDEAGFADYLKPATLLSLLTGLRRGELLTLTWADVDFDHDTVRVADHRAKSKKERLVDLTREARQILLDWKQQAHAHWVFANEEGEPYRVIKEWAALRDAAGLPGLRWHDLRHSFATRLVQAGADIESVRVLMGHASIRTTEKYFHTDRNQKKRAVAQMENLSQAQRAANGGAALAA